MTAYNLGLHFEEVVASSPGAVALFCEGDSCTFRTSTGQQTGWLDG